MKRLRTVTSSKLALSPGVPSPIDESPRAVSPMTLTDRAEALFASSLQPADHPGCDKAENAIREMLETLDVADCAAVMAAEFGEHPETATDRMRWALSLVRAIWQDEGTA